MEGVQIFRDIKEAVKGNRYYMYRLITGRHTQQAIMIYCLMDEGVSHGETKC